MMGTSTSCPFFSRDRRFISRGLTSCGDLLHLQFILCHILEIELVEVGEPAVSAPDGKVPASDRNIMWTGCMTMPAFCRLNTFPEIIAPDLCKCARCGHFLGTGDKDPCRPAVVACNLRLVGHRLYDLVCHLLAVVTVSTVFREDKPVAHKKYWMRPGSLTCCRISATLTPISLCDLITSCASVTHQSSTLRQKTRRPGQPVKSLPAPRKLLSGVPHLHSPPRPDVPRKISGMLSQ